LGTQTSSQRRANDKTLAAFAVVFLKALAAYRPEPIGQKTAERADRSREMLLQRSHAPVFAVFLSNDAQPKRVGDALGQNFPPLDPKEPNDEQGELS
jgi:hypothetical protein